MNIDTMRKLDYYAGVPLCFLGTVIKKVLSLFFRDRDPGSPPHNILFIELSEIGSTILADPAMRKAEEALHARLYFVIFQSNRPGLDLLNAISPENIFSIRDSGLLRIAGDSVRFFAWCRKNHIDTVVDLELFSRFTALLSGYSGATRRVGFHAFHNEGLYRGDFLTHRVAYNPHLHIAKNFIALVNALLSAKKEIPYSKTLVGDEEVSVRKVPADEQTKRAMLHKIGVSSPAFEEGRFRIVLFNTDASDLVPLRRWPEAYYIALARMVLERYPDVMVLLVGSPSERAGKERIVSSVGSGRCVNFAGFTSLTDLPALYSISSLMVTNDSGPAHFASVTDMPVFVLFGPETPKLYGPLGAMTPLYAGLACSPCVTAANHRKTACSDNVCLQIITPEQVFQAVRPNLDILPA